MPTNFLETDKALEMLLEELKVLKSSSQQLQDAGKMANQVIQSAGKVTSLSAQVMDNGTRQTDAIKQLAMDTEQRIKTVVAQQESFATEIEQLLTQEVRPQLTKHQRTATTNRLLIVLLLLLVVIDLAVTLWTNQAQLIRWPL